MEITQEDINKYVANGGYLSYLSKEQIRAIPQEIINQRVATGLDSRFDSFSLIQFDSAIYVENIDQMSLNGGGLNMLSIEQKSAIPQEIINQCAAKGVDLIDFSEEQIRAIPQNIINQLAANGGYLNYLLKEQIRAIPQEIINQRVANGGNLYHLLEEQIRAIPQEIINQRAAKGKYLIGLLEEQISAIPQGIINQYAAKGGELGYLSKEQIRAIPQEDINQYVANGGHLSYLSEQQIAEIPKVITEISRESIEALILYGSGKIKKEDLPANIFLNRHLRAALLKIIDVRLIKQYNKICKDHGYVDYVPDKVKKSFDKKVQEIEQVIIETMQKKLEEINTQMKNDEDSAIDDINKMEL